MGHFLCGAEKVNHLGCIQVHLHYIVSNPKKISKISKLPPWKNFDERHH